MCLKKNSRFRTISGPTEALIGLAEGKYIYSERDASCNKMEYKKSLDISKVSSHPLDLSQTRVC